MWTEYGATAKAKVLIITTSNPNNNAESIIFFFILPASTLGLESKIAKFNISKLSESSMNHNSTYLRVHNDGLVFSPCFCA
jgi:hypothetical protein